ncbi:MAG: phosphatase PAP2 family protein [Planctomycetota bacterium]
MEDNKLAEGTSIRVAGGALALGSVLRQLAWPMLVTYALLPATFLFPVVDSTREPYFDLTSAFATVSYWAAQSGGTIGAPIIGVLMLVLLITRHGISGARRTLEVALVVIVVAVCAGGGAALNEHGVKVAFEVPRPNIVYLAGADGAGPLGMSPEEFYGKGDKKARREPLRKVLEAEPPPVELAPAIREHWIEETGYSFPSGHSFSSMFFATFFLATGVSYISTRRIWLFYLLLPWALAVCYSRLILRVHTPTDITVGGLEGVVLGFVAFLLVRAGLTVRHERFS